MALLALSGAWVVGILLALSWEVSPAALGLFVVASLLLVALLMRVRRPAFSAVVLCVLLLGMLRVEASGSADTSVFAPYRGIGTIQLRGVVVGDPEPAGAATRLRLKVDGVRHGDQWTGLSGELLVTTDPPPELTLHRTRPYFRYGDRLLLAGALSAPPELEDFDYAAYLARQGIDTVMSFPRATLLETGQGNLFYRWLHGARRSLARSLGKSLPDPQAGLGQALLVGLRDDIPDTLVDQFQKTGASHLLAISGLHLGILMGIGLTLGERALGRRRQLYLLAPLVMIWVYALVAGLSPSVTRAAIMGTVYLSAYALGRPRSILPALGFAAAVMAAIDPGVIRTVSFQLSFAAMAGIAAWSEPLARRLAGARQDLPAGRDELMSLRYLAATMAAMTFAATVVTFPMVAFYFQRVSLVGLPTTLLTLPALPVILVTQAITGLVGLVSTSVATPFAWLAWLATSYLTETVGVLARLPAASIETGRVAPVIVLAYYGTLALLYTGTSLARVVRVWFRRATPLFRVPEVAQRGLGWWALALVASVSVLLWIAALSVPDGRLHVIFFDVGEGDAALIVTPQGKQVLVDGGPDPQSTTGPLGRWMPFRDRTVELAVLTHPHSDHVVGLTEVLERYTVERILERQVDYGAGTYQAWRSAVAREGATVTQAQSGQVVVLDSGVFIEVVSPPGCCGGPRPT